MSFSTYISFGKHKGFKLIERDGPSIRTRLWVVSFCFTFTDIESIIRSLLNNLDNLDNKGKETETDIEKRIVRIDSEKEILERRKKELKEQRINFKKNKNELQRKNEDLNCLVKKYEEKFDKMDDQILELNDELSAYEDTDTENDELKTKLDTLNKQLTKLKFELEYLEIYFNLK